MTRQKRDSKKTRPRKAEKIPKQTSGDGRESDKTGTSPLSSLRYALDSQLEAIIRQSKVIMEAADEKEYHDFRPDLLKIHGATDRLNNLVNELFDPKKIDTARAEAEGGEIGAGMRHALRTPLNAIIGYSEMLIEDATDKGHENLARDLGILISAAERFQSVIDDEVNFPVIEPRSEEQSPETSETSSGVPDHDITPTNRGSLLVVDDSELNRDMLTRYLKRQGHAVMTADNGRKAIDLLKEHAFDLIVLDIMMPEMNGVQVLEYLKAHDAWSDIPVIVISALDEMDSVVQCIQLGAEDYLLKPFNQVLLNARIQTCLEKKRLKELTEALELRNLKEEVQFIAESRAMQNVLNTVRSVSRNPVNVLLRGESGTGKEVIARMIHNHSDRKNKTFVAVNCASIPENLMESEFFGYEKGAFTGAVSSRRGRFEEADGGTLFLDEIGDMPLTIQPKFLRAIEEGEGRRLGSNESIRYDFRIISATNRDIRQAVTNGKFREDLFYRFFSMEIDIPPVRDRREDILPLTLFFIYKVSKRFKKKIAGFSSDVLNFFENYPWPGNVRQLLHEVERLVSLTPENEWASLNYCSQDLQAWRNSSAVALLHDRPDLSLTDKINELEVACIKEALRKSEGKKLEAAKLLGITRQGLRKKLRRYNICLD